MQGGKAKWNITKRKLKREEKESKTTKQKVRETKREREEKDR